MKVQELKIADFDYNLPTEKIALHPLDERDACKLLHLIGDRLEDCRFSNLPDLLLNDSVLVFNNTKVINARLEFFKSTGAKIEIFLLEPSNPADYERSFASHGEVEWTALVGGLKRWKNNQLSKEILLSDGEKATLAAQYISSASGAAHKVRLFWTPQHITFSEIVNAAGEIPIPPYLDRKSEEADRNDYQTVYSRIKGSVAAPTAGLHFTHTLLERLKEKGIMQIPVTLHVGAGTFQPVKSENISGHQMHTEIFSLRRDSLNELIKALEKGKRIVGVGTTSVRTLESLPYLGRAISRGDYELSVDQWEAYSPEKQDFDTISALKSILNYMDMNHLDSLTARTSIMIAPGFRWRIVSDLITNFHQPQSTLLLLVSSFLGDDPNAPKPLWRSVYKHALDSGYRFLSYGDACLFHRKI